MARRNYPTSLAHPRYWLTWAGIAAVWLVGQLPWRPLLWLGRQLGRLSWHLARSRRHTAETNIRLCFPELNRSEQQALARASMISMGEALTEIAGSYCNRWVNVKRRFTFKGMEHIESARQAGQGVIMLGMHFNTLDLAARVLGETLNYSAVYRPNDNPAVEKLIAYGRGRFTENYITRDDTRAMVRLLRKGGLLWYAPDQDYGRKHAVYVPFFGQAAATITATSRLAGMGRALVIPVAHYRHPGGYYTIEFGAPLEQFPGDDETADTARINQVIEQYVRRQPEQYLWVHRRFKHQPPGEPNPYKG